MKQVWVQLGDLLLDPGDHTLGSVADRGDRDAGAEVDQVVAVDVDQDPATRTDDVRRKAHAHPCGDRRTPAGLQLLGLRAGQIGDEAAFLSNGHGLIVGALTSCCRMHECSRLDAFEA